MDVRDFEGTAIVALAVATATGAAIPGWWFGLVGVLIVAGLSMGPLFDVQRRFRLNRLETKILDLIKIARWTQDLRCSACSHQFVETVRRTSEGYLKEKGEPRTCPSRYNSTRGFTGGPTIEANEAAARLRSIEKRMDRLRSPR